MSAARRNLWWCVAALAFAGPGCSDDADGLGDGDRDRKDAGDPFHNPELRDGSVSPFRDGSVPIFGRDARIDCGSTPFGADAVAPNLLLVIDKSGSMLDIPDGYTSDKWTVLGASLEAALDPVRSAVALGLQLYPLTDACGVPEGNAITVDVQPGAVALTDILGEIAAAAPSGGTPTAAALAHALAYYKDGAGKSLKGQRFVVLATDGGPNCNAEITCEASACTTNLDGDCPGAVANCCDSTLAGAGAEKGCLDDAATKAAIEALAAEGIPTFVIGIPGTEMYATSLDQFAVAGERVNPDAPPSYFAVTSAGSGLGGLTSILESITSAVVTNCRLQLTSDPPDTDYLNVSIEGAFLPKGDGNWDLDLSTSPPTVVLMGETCERVETEGVESITVEYGCITIVD
jgi:hypothetical protein